MDQDQLIQIVKQWVKIDNDIRDIQKEQNKLKVEKKTVTKHLMEIMKNNKVDCFEINDGQLVYKKKNFKKAITNKILLTSLSSFYNNDQKQVEELHNFILENRENTITECIVRNSKSSNHSSPKEGIV